MPDISRSPKSLQLRFNPAAEVSVRDQLRAQLEMAILTGELPAAARLPPVRVVARRLGLHTNTVSRAYRDLHKAGNVVFRKGAGVFVRSSISSGTDARALHWATVAEVLRRSTDEALKAGVPADLIRKGVAAWTTTNRRALLMVDPSRDMHAIYLRELRGGLRRQNRARLHDRRA